METTLENHKGTVNIGGRSISNLRFVDDKDRVAQTEEDQNDLVESVEKSCNCKAGKC